MRFGRLLPFVLCELLLSDRSCPSWRRRWMRNKMQATTIDPRISKPRAPMSRTHIGKGKLEFEPVSRGNSRKAEWERGMDGTAVYPPSAAKES